MAGWLLRAIVMENVAARRQGAMLDLPAAPQFRLEKEIKNVITVTAKTCHYWVGHVPRAQQQAIAELLPADGRGDAARGAGAAGRAIRRSAHAAAALAETIQRETGLRRGGGASAGWLGVECDSVRAAVWMMRALVASNVLARREGTALFVPVNPTSDPGGHRVAAALATRLPVCLGARRALTAVVVAAGLQTRLMERLLPVVAGLQTLTPSTRKRMPAPRSARSLTLRHGSGCDSSSTRWPSPAGVDGANSRLFARRKSVEA